MKRNRVEVEADDLKDDDDLNGVSKHRKQEEESSSVSGAGYKSEPCLKFFSVSGCPLGEDCPMLHDVLGGITTVVETVGYNPALPNIRVLLASEPEPLFEPTFPWTRCGPKMENPAPWEWIPFLSSEESHPTAEDGLPLLWNKESPAAGEWLFPCTKFPWDNESTRMKGTAANTSRVGSSITTLGKSMIEFNKLFTVGVGVPSFGDHKNLFGSRSYWEKLVKDAISREIENAAYRKDSPAAGRTLGSGPSESSASNVDNSKPIFEVSASTEIAASSATDIIGFEGINFRVLSRMAGADVLLKDHESDPNLKRVEIRGSVDQTEKARQMLCDLIENVAAASRFPPKKFVRFGVDPVTEVVLV